MKTQLNLFVLCICVALVSGCGTTAKMKPAPGADLRSLQKYNQVCVLDFANKTSKKSDAGSPA